MPTTTTRSAPSSTAGRERDPTAGRAVDVPACGLGGLVDAHRGEQGRDGGGGHQVGDAEPGGDVAAVVLDGGSGSATPGGRSR